MKELKQIVDEIRNHARQMESATPSLIGGGVRGAFTVQVARLTRAIEDGDCDAILIIAPRLEALAGDIARLAATATVQGILHADRVQLHIDQICGALASLRAEFADQTEVA
ncbi:MAG: hypothetical protein ACRD2J_00195 [Thermoanaerobaculia bacterium]